MTPQEQNWRKSINHLVRENYTLGGNFYGKNYQGLCFTYDQLVEKEKKIEAFISSLLEQIIDDIPYPKKPGGMFHAKTINQIKSQLQAKYLNKEDND